MRPEDIRDTTTKLNRILRERKLQWVVEEVSRVIESGVEEKKSIAFETFTLEGHVIPKRGPRSEVTATRPYTDEEQLELLLDAVKNVLVDGSAMRVTIFQKLAEGIPNPEIRFQPDIPHDIQERGFVALPEDQGEAFVLTPNEADRTATISARLQPTISRTKEELGADK